MTGSSQNATALAQHMIEATASALLTSDFARFADFFAAPVVIGTEDGIAEYQIRDDLRATFERAVEHYRALGVDHIDRQVEFACFDDAGQLRFSYLSRLLREGTLVRAPYPNVTTCRKIDGSWRIVTTLHLVADIDQFSEALVQTAGASPAQAVALFQTHLDGITQAYLSGDFAALERSVSLPLFMQGSSSREVFATRDALKTDFMFYQKEFEANQITDIVRLVKTAAFAGPNHLHGTYRTHILQDVQLFMPSYSSAISMERDHTDTWKISTIMRPSGHWTRANKHDQPRPELET